MTTSDSERLRRELLLRSVFTQMPPAAHVRLVDRLEEMNVDAGETILEYGEAPSHILFLAEGKVKMEAPAEPPWVLTAVAVVGVVDAVLERPRKRNCTTLEPSRLLRLQASDWFDLMEDNAQVARAVIKNIATQLHRRWQKVATRLPQSEPPRGITPAMPDSFDKVLALRNSAFVKRAGMQAQVSLASVAEPVMLGAGETLFAEGAASGDIYVVASGLIEFAQGDLKVRYRSGELVGGPAALGQMLSGYSARAIVPSVALRIAEQDFYDRAEEHERLTRSALAYLVSELEPMLALESQNEKEATESGAPLAVDPTA